ncbi:MAG TPA: TonB-dependent receptor [Caulobacteraceae bacterium]
MYYRAGLRAALLATSAMAAAYAAPAWAQQSRTFDLPAQAASSGIAAFAEQADIQILVMETDTRGRQTRAVQGSMTTAAGLNALLDGSGLKVIADDGRTITLAAADPQSGSAAGDGADSGTVEALIVTAQKREEDIQDVPIAISAFTQEDLTRSQVAGGPDLITQVPNFTFTKTNFSSYSIQIRGIGTQAISATTDPAVAVAFNNTPFIRNRFFEQEFYDLARVEVLRGPQGTLYGRNATGGVVNIISQKPRFNFEAKASGDLGNFSSTRLEGMVNIPLVEDKVALRLAGAWTKRDGYATNELTGNPIDGRDLWSTRLSLRVTPNHRIDANLIWEHFEEDDDRLRSGKQLCHKDLVTNVGGVGGDPFSPIPDYGGGANVSTVQSVFSQGCEAGSLYSPDAFQTPTGQSIPYYYQLQNIGLPAALDDPYASLVQSPDLRVIESTVDPDYKAKTDIAELQLSFDITDNLTLVSETSYGDDFVWSLQDFNRFNTAPGAWSLGGVAGQRALARGVLDENGVFCDPQLGCSDRRVAVDLATSKSTQFSEELRLSSDFEGAFNFSLGANFLRADSYDKYYVFINSISLLAAAGPPFNTYPTYVPGQTDNIDFILNGYFPGNPGAVYPVQAAVYMDPNPIGSLNDQGHNYFLSNNPYKLISYAAFGEAYYKLYDNLKVTAGLRWTVDKKEAPRIPTWILAAQSVGYPVANVIEQEWREPTGRLAVDWKPGLGFTDETLLYASYARGYKAGGANPPGFIREYYGEPDVAQINVAASATRPRTFDAEFVDAFELGSKNTILDGKATVNLAAFYYDYRDYQISEIVDRSAFNRNFDATVWGVELESDWRPVDNLRLGLKVGYQKTRIADGERAIDLMDRTAGREGWSVVRPFPTYASNCILPTALYVPPGGTVGGYPIWGLGGPNGGNPGGCEIAYGLGLDPVTEAPYGEPPASDGTAAIYWWNNPDAYEGFNPFDPEINNGEGFFKELGGNELPNAPHWTATLTGDYTLPLPNEWLMTLHSDVHWQSQSWWRVFNDLSYDKLHPYFTMNLAAIFTNEGRGWNIMAYIKNVTDETAITGAFLNSDDTGLTTNVFLTEPRLYGLRVTKSWSGGPTFGGFGARHEGPYSLTVELGGQIQRHDAPTTAVAPEFSDAFAAPLDVFDDAQGDNLDWGDGREVTATYRPNGGLWSVSAAYRSGETNGDLKSHAQTETDPVCGFGDFLQFFCDATAEDLGSKYILTHTTEINHAEATVIDREEHSIVDLSVGRDVGFGRLSRSTVELGLRYADLTSKTAGTFRGIPDWDIQDGFFFPFPGVPATHTTYDGRIDARREFDGIGPVASWDAAYPLLGNEDAGVLNLDWRVTGGVLFGDQSTTITGSDRAAYFSTTGLSLVGRTDPDGPYLVTVTPMDEISRSKSVTVPTAAVSLGLSYEVDRFKVGAGYRWERYFDAIDGGFEEHQSEDRTIDGPYFKLSVGFGG